MPRGDPARGAPARRGGSARRAACPGCPTASRSPGVAGDQQAALFGQACFEPGDAKCTYGTGAFLLMNIGAEPMPLDARAAHHRGLDAGHRARDDVVRARGQRVHRRRAGAVAARRARASSRRRADIEALARSVPDSGGVIIVPALAGPRRAALAARGARPHHRPHARHDQGAPRARGARGDRAAERRSADRDAGRRRACRSTHLRVDGGAAANDLLMQIQADLLGVQIVRPEMVESTALGAAKLAALGVGLPPGRTPGGETARMRMFTPTDGRPASAPSCSRAGRWPSRGGPERASRVGHRRQVADGKLEIELDRRGALFANVDPSMTGATACRRADPSLPRGSRPGCRTRGSSARENEDAFGSFAEAACSSSPTAWAATTPARSPAAMAIDAIEGFFTSFHADPRQPWPYPRRSRAVARREPAARRHQGRERRDPRSRRRRPRARPDGRHGGRDGGRREAGRDRARGRQPRLPPARRRAEAADARPLDRRGDARRAPRDDRRGAGRLRAPQRRHAQPGQQGRARAGRLRQQGRSRATSTCSAATGCGARCPTRAWPRSCGRRATSRRRASCCRRRERRRAARTTSRRCWFAPADGSHLRPR